MRNITSQKRRRKTKTNIIIIIGGGKKKREPLEKKKRVNKALTSNAGHSRRERNYSPPICIGISFAVVVARDQKKHKQLSEEKKNTLIRIERRTQ